MIYQAKPELEIRSRILLKGVFAKDGTQPIFLAPTFHECAAYIVGFEKAWEIKADIQPDPFTEALAQFEEAERSLDAFETYTLEDR